MYKCTFKNYEANIPSKLNVEYNYDKTVLEI